MINMDTSDLKLQVSSSGTSHKKRIKSSGMSSHSSQVLGKTASTRSGRILKLQEKEKLAQPVTPLIKVIHIYNPTVIKTDAANFRALVQKLTGKPCGSSTIHIQSSAQPIQSLSDATSLTRSQKDGQLINSSHSQLSPAMTSTLKSVEISDHDSSGSGCSTGANASCDSVDFWTTSAKTVDGPDRLGAFLADLDESYDFISSFQLPQEANNIYGMQAAQL